VLGVALLAGRHAEASLSRNAAGPRNMGEDGVLTVDTAAELHQAPEERMWTVEAAVQYQAMDRLQLLVEPVLLVDHEEAGSGLGDTELTVSWLVLEIMERVPVVVAGKVKLPTAGSPEFGTGKADYSGLLILGAESGELEVSLETEVATYGAPAGEELKDQFLYTFTVEYGLAGFLAVFAEAFGESAPAPGESRTDGALAGLELELQVTGTAAPYMSVEFDTDEVATVRGGVEWNW
jgi:hypothetical protein